MAKKENGKNATSKKSLARKSLVSIFADFKFFARSKKLPKLTNEKKNNFSNIK